jgi:hypothetical protein
MIYIYTEQSKKKFFFDYINSIIYTYKNIYKNNEHGEIEIIEDFNDLHIKINQNHSKDRFIFLQTIPLLFKNNDKRIYFINTEQLSKSEWVERISNYPPNIKIIDYSLTNIQYLEPYRTPIYYLPYTVNSQEIMDFPKIYDICTVMGCLGNYRSHILNQLIEKNIKYTSIEDKYGMERDEILFQHKILLNIHFNERFEVFEEMRCNRCILNKMIVITQKSKTIENGGAFQKLRNHMIECEYDELVDTVIDVSNRYEEYYHKLFDNFNLKEITQEYEKEFGNTFDEILLER